MSTCLAQTLILVTILRNLTTKPMEKFEKKTDSTRKLLILKQRQKKLKYDAGPILKLVTLGENRIFVNNRFPVSCKVI